MINEIQAYAYCNSDISLIENYDKAVSDPNETWHCHHKMGVYCSREELKEYGWYYNCSPDCLIFLTSSEHKKQHCYTNKGRKHNSETKAKISASMKGKRKDKCRCEISKKILEHYGFYERKLYMKEKRLYGKNGKFSWEVI